MHNTYTQQAAADKQKLFANAAELLIDNGNDKHAHTHALWVPGRVEVVGKHTDYAGGRWAFVLSVPSLSRLSSACVRRSPCPLFSVRLHASMRAYPVGPGQG